MRGDGLIYAGGTPGDIRRMQMRICMWTQMCICVCTRVHTDETSSGMRSAASANPSSITRRASTSLPTTATKCVIMPRRAHATAWLNPRPPG